MQNKYDQLFARLSLPVRPADAVNGATIQLIQGEEQAPVQAATPFFGGYAEDFLGDMGFESLASTPEGTSVRKAK